MNTDGDLVSSLLPGAARGSRSHFGRQTKGT